MDIEQQFKHLKDRYFKAEKYYKTQYDTDTEPGKAKANKAMKELVKQLDDIWEQVRYKQIAIVDIQQVLKIVEALREDFWFPTEVNCYRKSKKNILQLERLPFWKFAKVVEE